MSLCRLIVSSSDNCHTFNWTKTQLLGQAQIKHVREFKEAWHSTDNDTNNRHIVNPTVYLQFKIVVKNATNNDTNMTSIGNYTVREVF